LHTSVPYGRVPGRRSTRIDKRYYFERSYYFERTEYPCRARIATVAAIKNSGFV
jgi:hypothetical protein